jgi:tagatose-1,6-bisphosphate aldolase non-catalytic subunit AgaZ/GatZ
MINEQEYHIYVNSGSEDMKLQGPNSNFETKKVEELSQLVNNIKLDRLEKFKNLYGTDDEKKNLVENYSYYTKAEKLIKNNRIEMTMDEFSEKLNIKTKKEMNYFLSTVNLVVSGSNSLSIIQKKTEIF